ncbi:hypothetical protein [uncultured Tateyamaria sp.]|uniref:hypothetical protein n=1 Tax=uncultured Tateyamaria sp. TaxID=455651 RepID=UPI002626FF53|nr:hypothetical protein [uncultured Tateyamaria sp.]
MTPVVSRGLSGLWAGVVIGGSLIAAPAKFQVTTLSTPQLLEVGRAQFHWVGIAEAALCAALLISVFLSERSRFIFLWIPVALFAIQRLYLMPLLDARTLEIIAGSDVAESSIHIVFIVLEITKVILLCGFAVGGLEYRRSEHASHT